MVGSFFQQGQVGVPDRSPRYVSPGEGKDLFIKPAPRSPVSPLGAPARFVHMDSPSDITTGFSGQ